jgi:hypothetical protein
MDFKLFALFMIYFFIYTILFVVFFDLGWKKADQYIVEFFHPFNLILIFFLSLLNFTFVLFLDISFFHFLFSFCVLNMDFGISYMIPAAKISKMFSVYNHIIETTIFNNKEVRSAIASLKQKTSVGLSDTEVLKESFNLTLLSQISNLDLFLQENQNKQLMTIRYKDMIKEWSFRFSNLYKLENTKDWAAVFRQLNMKQMTIYLKGSEELTDILVTQIVYQANYDKFIDRLNLDYPKETFIFKKSAAQSEIIGYDGRQLLFFDFSNDGVKIKNLLKYHNIMYQKQIELNQFISVLSRLPIGEKTFVFGYSKAGDFALLVNSTKMGIIVECKSVIRVLDIEAFFSKKDKLFINNEIYPGRLFFFGDELVYSF